uniref:Uncharacterized protein n=1 Tax=Manihot esculenta TaxID=3983 RepID=A0A2C9UBT2_MANES
MRSFWNQRSSSYHKRYSPHIISSANLPRSNEKKPSIIREVKLLSPVCHRGINTASVAPSETVQRNSYFPGKIYC